MLLYTKQKKIHIEKIGKILKTDKNGYLIKQASLELITPKWMEIINAAIDEYKKGFGSQLHSIYVRGSIAQGTSTQNTADVDTILIIKTLPKTIDKEWIDMTKKKLQSEFPFVRQIEIIPTSIMRISDRPDLQFFLKIQSVCVYGDDINTKLPDVKPGRSTAIHSRNINKIITNQRKEILGTADTAGVKNLCSNIMKRFLRIGYELVAEREKAFTRDYYFCYEGFRKYYPDKALAMYHVMELALNPIANKSEIIEIIDILGNWLKSETIKIFN